MIIILQWNIRPITPKNCGYMGYA